MNVAASKPCGCKFQLMAKDRHYTKHVYRQAMQILSYVVKYLVQVIAYAEG